MEKRWNVKKKKQSKRANYGKNNENRAGNIRILNIQDGDISQECT